MISECPDLDVTRQRLKQFSSRACKSFRARQTVKPVRRKIIRGNAQKVYKVTGPSAADEAKLAPAVGV